jgi:ATP/maltotriose-dependent transcriptional regulator MalT
VLPGETEGVATRVADAEAALAAAVDGDPAVAAVVRTQLALIRSRLADLEGDVDTALAQARLAGELLPAGLPGDAEATLRGDATILLARGLLAAGDTDRAAEAYAASIPDLRAGGNVFALGRAIADLAALAIRRGDPAEAARICEAELERTPQETTARTSPAVWAALARARAESRRYELARAAADRALELATRAGDGQAVRSARATLARIEEAEGPAGVGPRGAAGTAGVPHAGAGVLVEPLTPRELEVLRLVALGRTNGQVAAELFVTVGTVKSHVHAISGKLGAANRVEAVARGRALGLLD